MYLQICEINIMILLLDKIKHKIGKITFQNVHVSVYCLFSALSKIRGTIMCTYFISYYRLRKIRHLCWLIDFILWLIFHIHLATCTIGIFYTKQKYIIGYFKFVDDTTWLFLINIYNGSFVIRQFAHYISDINNQQPSV